MAEQQKFTVEIPENLDQETRAAIGVEIVDFIIKRSQGGKDKNNVNFPAYSKSYVDSFDFDLAGKDEKPNLTLTGEMLNALTVLENEQGKITIGIPSSDDFNNAKAEGNIKGTYGRSTPDPAKARDFMGIATKDLDSIVNKFSKGPDADANVFATLRAAAASTELANSFLRIEGEV